MRLPPWKTRWLLTAALLAALAIPPTSATAASCANISGSGHATSYTYTPGSGNCSFDGDEAGPYLAAINAVDYAGSRMCGAWLHVTGPLGSVDVRIVDQCPTCPAGDLDLNTPAFAAIGNLSDGVIPVTWKLIEDPAPGIVFVQEGAGTNAFFLQVQPRDGLYPIDTVEYLAPSGYVTARRETYNYFTIDGSLGVPLPLPGLFTLRITDVNGARLVVPGIPLAPGHLHPSSQQFPACVTLDVPAPASRAQLALHIPSPNPFRRSTALSFDLPREGDVVLRLYDASGRQVRTLVRQRLPAGSHHVTWDGVDDAGRRLSAGLYFCRLAAGAAVDQVRITLTD